jgi:DNA-binding NarL/FixJ family response regulator
MSETIPDAAVTVGPARRDPHRAVLRDLGEVLAELSRKAMEESEYRPAPPSGGLAGQLTGQLAGQLSGGRADCPGITYLYGLPELNLVLGVAVAGARRELLTAQPGGAQPSGPFGSLPPSVLEPLRGGVPMRTLYQHTAQFDEETKEDVRTISGYGARARTLDELFGRVVIVDGVTAFIPVNDGSACAARITDPATVRFLADLFEYAWMRAELFPFIPLRAAEAAPRVVPAIHEAIQRLLVEGLSDKAIARRLAISERSLQAHVFRIKQELGAQNRIQLGYLLGRAGDVAA